MAPVTTIFLWETACTGTIGGPAQKCLDLHKFHAKPVCTALTDSEGIRSGGPRGTYFNWALSQMALGHVIVF